MGELLSSRLPAPLSCPLLASRLNELLSVLLRCRRLDLRLIACGATATPCKQALVSRLRS